MRLICAFAIGLVGTALLACVRQQAASVASSASPSPTPLALEALADNVVKRRALYFPNARVYGSKPDGFQELDVLTSDGLTLDAWYKAPPKDGYLLLYFHGNGGNLTSLGPQFEAFVEAGAGVLAVDYRGYGKSEGVPSEAGLYLDAEAVYARAAELGYSPERVVIFGRSLGGGVATYLAKARPAAGLILESTFTSVTETARRSHGARAALLVAGFPSLERMPSIPCPILIIHGTADQTIPPDMAGALAEASPDAEVWMVEGADHNTVRKCAGTEYVERLRAFLYPRGGPEASDEGVKERS